MTHQAGHLRGRLPYRDRDPYRVISVVGDFDIANVAMLEAVLDRAFECGRVPALDFSPTRYIDSSVLNAIVRKMDGPRGRLHVIVPAGCEIRRIFDITGLTAALGAVESEFDLD